MIAYALFGLAFFMSLRSLCRLYAGWVVGLYVVMLPAFLLILVK